MAKPTSHAIMEGLHRTGLTGTAAVAAASAMIAVAFTGSTLVTPLYTAYERIFGFSTITLTLIYSVYVVGNLAALLFFGRLSDQLGRRPVGLMAMVLAAVSALLFLFAHGTAWLYGARALSGLAVGLASGTGTAWLVDLHDKADRPRATLMATCANFVGIAAGPLLAGILAQYAPWPLHLSYLVYLSAIAAVGFLVAHAAETVEQQALGGEKLSFRPRLGIPSNLRAAFIAPAATAFGTFALVGFYAALIPSILMQSLHEASRAVSGAVVFELFAIATLAMIATRSLASRTAMLSGLTLLLPSVALLAIAQALGSMPVLLVATAFAGISSALGYRGSLQVVNQLAPDDRRAEVVSTYYLACFVGNSVPVIGVGVVTVMAGSVTASLVFASTVAVFAVAALVTGAKLTPKA